MPSTSRSSDPRTSRTGMESARILSCMRRGHARRGNLTMGISQGDSSGRGWRSNFLMRLKIEIPRRLFRDAGKNGSGDGAAVGECRILGMGIVKHDKTDKGLIFGGKEAAKGDDVFVFFVAAAGSSFLSGASFAGHGETRHRRLGCRAALTHDAAQSQRDLRSGLR